MDKLNIHVLHCGKVRVDQALPFREKTWHPVPQTGWFRPESKKMWVPVSAYLIEHPKGLVLIDTGWHEQIRTDYNKHVGWLTSTMFQGELPAWQSISEQLQQRGIQPVDLAYVVISHMHSDHVSGLPHVKDAGKIIVSQKEWEAAHKQFGYIRSMWKGISIETFDFDQTGVGPYGLSYDLFGDDLIHLVYTPGHARGQISVLIKQTDGYVLLASDVGYATKSWEEMILPGHLDHEKEAYDSLLWVRDFAKRGDCKEVLANHDPMIQPKTI